MKNRVRFTILAGVLLLASCASQPLAPAAVQLSIEGQPATSAEACRHRLGSGSHNGQSALDASDIHVFNWNMQKARHVGALDDMDTLAGDKDLILIQEAALGDELLESSRKARFWSFAPGYRNSNQLTGVMTLSASVPLTRCSLASREPWLGTPKATSVTEYALSGTDQTLVVVNIHAINFTFGLRHFREQLEQVSAALTDHDGPLIFSGDFNTWRKQRQDLVTGLSSQLGLQPVRFDDDQRKLVFGQALDHIYVRGLKKKEASTGVVSTSDHNPMTVRLAL